MLTNSIHNITVINKKKVFKNSFSSLLVTAVVFCLFGAVFTVTSFAAPSRFENGGECRSQVFDLVTPEDIPSDGKVVKPAQNGPRKTKGSVSAETENYIPLVMIVIGFKGQPYNTTYDWSNRIFKGDTSLSQYYKDMSFGKFTFLPAQESSASGVDGNKSTTDQVNDGIIHITLNTEKNKGWSIDYNRSADLENMIAFANALDLAGNYINFGDYDSNGDGMIQNSELAVGFIVAGRDASCSSISSTYKKYYIWPNAYSFSECRQDWKSNLSGFPEVPVIDGVKVDGYIAIAESYDTNGRYNSSGNNLAQEYIGTLAHELGHYLGLPDLYDTGSGGGSWSSYDMSYLSLMNYGCYGEDPDRNPIPFSLDIWSRVTLGWVESVTLDSGEDVSITGSLNPSENIPVAVRVNTSRNSEYYLIENRRFSGWDAGMAVFYPDFALSDGEDLGGGLLLWHIDDDIIDAYMSWNSVINSYHRPGVTPLFWEYNGSIQDTIGTSVNTKKAFFDAKLWGTDLAFPLYKADDLSSDKPADRSRSGLVLSFKNESAPVMQVQLRDLSGIYSPPGGYHEDDPGQSSLGDPDDIDLFNMNRDALLTVAENLRQQDDSKECIDFIENAKNAILELSYDDDLNLEENNNKVSDIVEQLIIDLKEQHKADQDAANNADFDQHKAEQKDAADKLAQDGDNDACKQLIEKAKADIDALSYDKDKTLDENNVVVDDIVSRLITDLTEQRNKDNKNNSSGGSFIVTYPVNLAESIENGSASVNMPRARSGMKVTITVTPDEGYQTESVTVVDKNGKDVTVSDIVGGVCTFTMPNSEVTVTPTFTKVQKPDDPGESVDPGEPDNTICPKDGTCPITPFTDTDKNAWYHDGVHWALEKGVMNGMSKTTFEPLTATSRAMIVTMLWRMEGSPKADGSVTFKDVQDGQWYTDAIRWAAANNIVNGYDADTFGINDSVTREQLATILYRSAQAKGQGFTGSWAFPLNFDDADQISEWADEAMHWMTMNGIIQGMSETILSPQGDAVRAQVATMLMRFSEIIQDQEVYLTLVNKNNKLPDNWLEIIELVSAHNSLGREFQVERVALEQFQKLRDALLNEGIDIELDSTYRSVQRQEELWAEFEEKYGLEYCQKYVAVPGFSEHHTGLAIDVCLIKNGEVIDDNDAMIAETEIFSKVHEKLADYGFILRYLPGKEDVTGYSYEPWHFRYVGEEPAREIMERGITLEEYLDDSRS